METASRPSRISRVDLRYRHLAQDISGGKERVQAREAILEGKEEDSRAARLDEPLLKREQKGRPVMGKAHRMFHRRMDPAPSNVRTIVVGVIATVDSNNNVIGLHTLSPGVPVVPPMPTDPLPSVPAVPPFPSDLTVPAYPFPSGPTIVSSQAPASSPTGSTSALQSAPTQSRSNSTISASSTRSTISFSTSSSMSRLFSSRSSSSSPSSSSPTPTSSASTLSVESSVAGGVAPAPTNPATGGPTALSDESNSDSSGPPTPTVVGSVVGGLAGLALLLALILFLLKRHKRKLRGGALQLPENDPVENQPIASSGQQMATRNSNSVIPTAFLNRFSSTSKSTVSTNATGEKSFQRISGRKLPSAFSEGMTSEQFARGEGTLSGSSFYTDDQGFYGGAGPGTKDFGKEPGSPSGAIGATERFMPSPAKTPVLHHPGDAPPWGTSRNGGSTLSPPHSPNPAAPPRGTLGRSHPSHDGSRGSRFTEDV